MTGSSLLRCPLRGDMGHGTAHSQDIFLIMLVLLPLSTYSQGGDGEFNWLGPPLSSVHANAMVRTQNMVQPLQTIPNTYLDVLCQQIDQICPLKIITYNNYPCPASCPHSQIMYPVSSLVRITLLSCTSHHPIDRTFYLSTFPEDLAVVPVRTGMGDSWIHASLSNLGGPILGSHGELSQKTRITLSTTESPIQHTYILSYKPASPILLLSFSSTGPYPQHRLTPESYLTYLRPTSILPTIPCHELESCF